MPPTRVEHWIEADTLIGKQVRTADEQSAGKITDLVVRGTDGTFELAVIQLGRDDRKVTVPFRHLEWKPDERTYRTDLTAEQIALRPAYDPVDLLRDPTDRKKAAKEADSEQSSGKPVEAVDRKHRQPSHYLLSSLIGSAVAHGDSVLGRVSEVVTQTQPASAALLLVRAGTDLEPGTTYVIPWGAVGANEKGQLEVTTIPRDRDMDGAPTLQKPTALDTPAFLQRLSVFYRVPAIALPRREVKERR